MRSGDDLGFKLLVSLFPPLSWLETFLAHLTWNVFKVSSCIHSSCTRILSSPLSLLVLPLASICVSLFLSSSHPLSYALL